MATQSAKSRRPEPVAQFAIFTPNRLGRLHDLISLLGINGVHVLALTVLDTTDSAIIRVIVDDPDRARELLHHEKFPFTESHVVAVEASPTDLARMMSVLLEAEVNINYLYSFIPQPMGKSMVALSLEDNELAEQALRRAHFNTLRQADISR